MATSDDTPESTEADGPDGQRAAENDAARDQDALSEPATSGHSTADTQAARNQQDESPS